MINLKGKIEEIHIATDRRFILCLYSTSYNLQPETGSSPKNLIYFFNHLFYWILYNTRSDYTIEVTPVKYFAEGFIIVGKSIIRL